MAAHAGHWNEPGCHPAGSCPVYVVGFQRRRSDGFPTVRPLFQRKDEELFIMWIRHIFVYGTLKRGMSNHNRFCGDALTIEPAVTTGRLYHLPYGFPAMFDALEGQVFGEVMTFPDIRKTLERLDRLEGYHPADGRSHYIRIDKAVSILNGDRVVSSWIYTYPNDRLRPDFIRVPSGCWSCSVLAASPPQY